MIGRKIVSIGMSAFIFMNTILMPANVSAAESKHSTNILGTSIENSATPLWLAPGKHTQYPNTGGVWRYGFWDLKVRSYYTVRRCHTSTVELNGDRVRSVKTAPGYESIAEKWAINLPFFDDHYYYNICD